MKNCWSEMSQNESDDPVEEYNLSLKKQKIICENIS